MSNWTLIWLLKIWEQTIFTYKHEFVWKQSVEAKASVAIWHLTNYAYCPLKLMQWYIDSMAILFFSLRISNAYVTFGILNMQEN